MSKRKKSHHGSQGSKARSTTSSNAPRTRAPAADASPLSALGAGPEEEERDAAGGQEAVDEEHAAASHDAARAQTHIDDGDDGDDRGDDELRDDDERDEDQEGDEGDEGDDARESRRSLEPREDVAEFGAYVPAIAHDGELDAEDELDEDERNVPRRPGDVATEMRAVEAELDALVDRARIATWERRKQEDSPLRAVVEKIREAVPIDLPGGENGDLVDAAKDVLSTDYYLRQWGKIGLRNRSEEVDEFGLDPVYEQKLRPAIDALYRYWFRVSTRGIEHVPADGRCILVANHSGVLPLDGLVVRTALRREHPSARELRWLAEDFIYYLPFVGAFMNRIGAVRACQENAERLLRQERAVLVFPEGIKGIGKLYKERYQLQRFGRGGFIKLALRTGAPIVPVSIVGAEEAAPMIYKLEYLTQAVGLPFVPVTPTFPALGPLGLLPAPTKWTIEFGAPIQLDEHGAEAADDALLVHRLAERVRGDIARMLERRLSERRSVWFG
jgi:1-acyl-sn-glycerol-3-phosphate acyltransferase